METQKTSSALATTLRVIGVLNVIGGIILGFNLCGRHGMFASKYGDENAVGLIFFVISGIIGCIICFALAKCVQAATIYLNSVTPKDKAAKPWLKGTIFDEEPSNSPQQ